MVSHKLDPMTAAAHRQAAKPGCANPNGWARWDYNPHTEELSLRGQRKKGTTHEPNISRGPTRRAPPSRA